MLDPANYTLFWSKNFRRASFPPLGRCQKSRLQILSIRRISKNYDKIFYACNIFWDLFLQYLFNGTCLEPKFLLQLVNICQLSL